MIFRPNANVQSFQASSRQTVYRAFLCFQRTPRQQHVAVPYRSPGQGSCRGAVPWTAYTAGGTFLIYFFSFSSPLENDSRSPSVTVSPAVVRRAARSAGPLGSRGFRLPSPRGEAITRVSVRRRRRLRRRRRRNGARVWPEARSQPNGRADGREGGVRRGCRPETGPTRAAGRVTHAHAHARAPTRVYDFPSAG